MVDLRDGFLRELDKETSGMEGHISHYTEVLEFVDEEIYDIIASNDVPH